MERIPGGTQPVFDPNRGFRQWLIGEIFTGPDGKGKFVPNVDDLVIDYTRGFLRVVAVDVTTGLSQLVDWNEAKENAFDDTDVLLGVGPGYTSETFRLFVNPDVLPHTATLDSRLFSRSIQTTHYKIFIGTDISANGRVVSAFYDQNEQYVDENIPLDKVTVESAKDGRYNVKIPRQGWVTNTLAQGQVVTVVMYAGSEPVSINKMLVVNSAFIRRAEASQRYITGISIDSPFLSKSTPDTLEIPSNLPMEALTLQGYVHYSDGSRRREAVNSGRMELFGLDNYIATITGQPAPLSLVYRLSSSEAAVNAQGEKEQHVSRSYKIVTEAPVGAYSVKLFVVPKYVSAEIGWRLEYYLYNLDRSEVYNATIFVEPGANTPPFDPNAIGVTQRLCVAVELEKVDPRLKPFRHVQTFAISIMANGLEDRTPYLLEYDPGQQPLYGDNLSAKTKMLQIGQWEIDISQNAPDLTTWLNKVYYPIKPLYDRGTEIAPPKPTHFVLGINGDRTRYPITEWHKKLASRTGGTNGHPVTLEWIAHVGGQDLQLGISGLKIHQSV